MSYQELMEKYLNTQKENEELKVENTKLQAKVDNQQLQINVLNKMIFGSKRESTKIEGEITEGEQCTLFEENDKEGLDNAVKNEVEEITVYKRKGKNQNTRAGIKRSALKGAKIIQKEYKLDGEMAKCDECGKELKIIGKEIVRKDVEVIPPEIRINVYIRYKYKCESCEDKAEEYESVKIIETAPPKALLPHSFVSPSLATEIIYEKYYKGVPLYRQEQMWDEKGLVIPRSMMANWCIKLNDYYLKPIYDMMLKEIKNNSEVLHADESVIQCNKEKGRKASSKSYMWVLATGKEEEKKGVIFKYNSSRSAKVAQEFIKGYTGILVTDGYEVYDSIENVTHAECWTHMRRYFLESVPLDSQKQLIKTSEGYKGVEYCDELFKIEREIEELKKVRNVTNEEIVQIRKKKSEPILKNFNDWVNLTSQKIILNDKLKKAITYATNQRKELSEFLNDGRIPLCNSLVERAIRPFAIGRKNWIFADSVAGAETNAVMYSIIESAKQNKLNVQKYIRYLLEELPQEENIADEEVLQKYMPWSKTLPEDMQNDEEDDDEILKMKDIEVS